MADSTIDKVRSALVSGLHATSNRSSGIGIPISVHIPSGNNRFLFTGYLRPSRGTGVFIPNVHETFHGGLGGAEYGGHGYTRRVPLGNNWLLHAEDLPPSRGTREFIPRVHETFHGGHKGAEDGGLGNTRRGDRANYLLGCEFGDRGTWSEPKVDKDEVAQLIGIELYKHISFKS